MTDELETFVDFLYDGLEGFVYSPVKRATSWDSHFYSWPSERTNLLDHIKVNGSEADVYLCPSVFSKKEAKKDSFKESQVVWVEVDGKEEVDFSEVSLPSAIIQTSNELHIHSYWKLSKKVLDYRVIEDANRRITYHLQADSSGWDSTQLLRPPTTTNHKHPLPVFLRDFRNTRVDISSFDSVPEVPRVYIELQEATLLDPVEVLVSLNLPSSLLKVIQKEIPSQGDRSQFYYRVASELAERECTHSQIASVLFYIDERVGKWSIRSDRLARISELASIVLHSNQTETEISLYSPIDVLDLTEDLDWIYKKWIHTQGLVIISGAPGVGKSQLLMNMMHAFSVGKHFLGLPATRKVRSLFMSLEMDVRELKYILKKQVGHLRKEPSFQSFQDNVRIFDQLSTLGEYEQKIIEFRPQVIFIDSLFELADGDLKENEEVRRIVRWMRRIRRKYNCAIIVIHHNRKGSTSNKKPNRLEDLFGSVMINKEVETAIVLWEDDDADYIDLMVVKARFAQKETIEIVRTDKLTFEIKEASTDPEPRKSEEPTGSINFRF